MIKCLPWGRAKFLGKKDGLAVQLLARKKHFINEMIEKTDILTA